MIMIVETGTTEDHLMTNIRKDVMRQLRFSGKSPRLRNQTVTLPDGGHTVRVCFFGFFLLATRTSPT